MLSFTIFTIERSPIVLKFKSVLSLFLSVMITIVCCSAVSAEFPVLSETVHPGDVRPQECLIREYWEYVNNGDWDKWANLYCSDVRDDHMSFAAKANNSDTLGILAVKACSVINIQQVSDEYAPLQTPLTERYPINTTLLDCSLG